MDFTYLQTFCKLAERGNFTRTAEELGYAQSSITTHIQKLEEQYGAILFERAGRKLKLTQAGEVLLPYARQILNLQAEAITMLSAQTTGTIRVGTIETLAAFFLPPFLQTFRRLYPGMSVALQAGTETTLIKAVKEGQCDLGLILDRPCTDEDLTAISLRKEEINIIVRPDTSFNNFEQIAVPELAHARFILTEDGCTYRALLLQALRQTGTDYQVMCEFGSLEAIKQCVIHGLGIAFLPRTAVQEEIEQGKLAAIPLDYPSDLYTQVVYPKKKWRSQALQSLLDLMVSGAAGVQLHPQIQF